MSIDSVNGAAGIRNTISGNKTILETENKLASVMAQKENTDSKIELKESEQVNKLAETNEDEAKQVEQISNTLAAVKNEYSASISAASTAQSTASDAQANASKLQAAANAVPKTKKEATGTIDQSTFEPIYKDVPNPEYEKMQKLAKEAQEKADSLKEQAEKLQEKAEELGEVCSNIEEALSEINENETNEEQKEDTELSALKEESEKFAQETEKLNTELAEIKEENAKNKENNDEYCADKTKSEGTYEVTNPDGSKSNVTVDSEGKVIIKDKDDTETEMSFDKNDKLTKTTIKKQNGNVTEITSKKDGSTTATVKNNKTTTTINYNDKEASCVIVDNETKEKTKLNNDGSMEHYDKNGKLTGQTTVQETDSTDNTDEAEESEEEIEKALVEAENEYDRNDEHRKAIFQHDKNTNVTNGFKNEDEIEGVLLDVDKYYDKYSKDYNKEDENEFKQYCKKAGKALNKDIAKYFGIDTDKEEGQEQLKAVYKQIIKNEELQIENENELEELSAKEYNKKVSRQIAKLSWDGKKYNDYIDLTNISPEAKESDINSPKGKTYSNLGNAPDKIFGIKENDGKISVAGINNLKANDKDIKNIKKGEKGTYKLKDEKGKEVKVEINENVNGKPYYSVTKESKEGKTVTTYDTELNSLSTNTYKGNNLVESNQVQYDGGGKAKNWENKEYNVSKEGQTQGFTVKSNEGEYTCKYEESGVVYYDKKGKEKYSSKEEAIKANEKIDKKTEEKTIKKYDRTDKERSAIINHDNLKEVTGGLEGTEEKFENDYKGTQLDLDKYFDKYQNYLIEGDTKGYKKAVAKDLKEDISTYFNINQYDIKAPEKLKNVYQQIALRAGISVDDTETPEEYVEKVGKELAKISNDDSFANDYINLDNIKTTQNAKNSLTENSTETGKAIIDFAKQYLGMGNQEEFEEPGAWCGAFVRYITKNCGKEVAQWYQDMPDWETHACRFVRDAANDADAIIDASEVEPGDIVLFDWEGGKTGKDHIAIVTKIENGKVYTIEGNWGNKVCEEERSLYSSAISYFCKLV